MDNVLLSAIGWPESFQKKVEEWDKSKQEYSNANGIQNLEQMFQLNFNDLNLLVHDEAPLGVKMFLEETLNGSS